MDQVLICIRLKWKLHLWICETKADACRILHLMRDFCVCTADCDAMKRRPRRKLRESLWHPDQKSSETLPADSYGGKWAAECWCHLKKWNSCHTCSLLRRHAHCITVINVFVHVHRLNDTQCGGRVSLTTWQSLWSAPEHTETAVLVQSRKDWKQQLLHFNSTTKVIVIYSFQIVNRQFQLAASDDTSAI